MTCGECRKFDWLGHFSKDGHTLLCMGKCRRKLSALIYPDPVVWADNGACPDFERKPDWADAVADRISMTPLTTKLAECTQMIREAGEQEFARRRKEEGW